MSGFHFIMETFETMWFFYPLLFLWIAFQRGRLSIPSLFAHCTSVLQVWLALGSQVSAPKTQMSSNMRCRWVCLMKFFFYLANKKILNINQSFFTQLDQAVFAVSHSTSVEWRTLEVRVRLTGLLCWRTNNCKLFCRENNMKYRCICRKKSVHSNLFVAKCLLNTKYKFSWSLIPCIYSSTSIYI